MKTNTRKHCTWIVVLLSVLTVLLLAGLVCAGVFFYYVKTLPATDFGGFAPLVAGQSQNSRLYHYQTDENGARIPVPTERGELYAAENRKWVLISEMPVTLIDAFLSIEDERFYSHQGVDARRTLGAVLGYVTGKKHYGGSTITQQLVKNLTGDDAVTVYRKLTEMVRARSLEKTLTKAQILELYLNTIYLSEHSYGVETAARTYFGKSASDLDLAESAALAAIVQAPGKWNPRRAPEQNKARRTVILDKMLALGKITEAEYAAARDTELSLRDTNTTEIQAVQDWYTETVIGEAIPLLASQYGVDRQTAEKMLYSGGYRIYTAMDPFVQQTLTDYFANPANFPRVDDSFVQPECAMVVQNPATGGIVGIVGGRGEKRDNRILNYATQTLRPPGSAIKPIAVYGPALEEKLIHAGSVFDDTPVNFTVRAGGWPVNFPAGYRGLTTIGDAVARSVNTVAVSVLDRLSPEASYAFLSQKLGVTSLVDTRSLTDCAAAPLALGQLSYGISVKELTAAYTPFAAGGVYHSGHTIEKILSADGTLLWQYDATGERVFSPENAQIMTNLLRGVTDHGTAARLSLKREMACAGKTGTTTADRDRWFVGYTPHYVAGVWFGYATPRELTGFPTLPSPAVSTWDKVMTALHAPLLAAGATTDFPDTGHLVEVAYCRDSGGIPTAACRADPRGNRTEVGYFTSDNRPTAPCTCHRMVACAPGGGVYVGELPLTGVRYYGLLYLPSRRLEREVPVLDAQYLWRPLDGAAPVLDGKHPFFAGTLGGGYIGISPTVHPFNRGIVYTPPLAEPEEDAEMPPE